MKSGLSLSQIQVTEIDGVGPKIGIKLARLGITTALDLLFHLPFRYQNRTQIKPIGAVREGMDLVVEGRIVIADVAPGRRRSLLVRIEDSTGIISARFYYFTANQRAQLQAGKYIRCFGEVRRGATGLEFYHPEYLIANPELPPLQQSLTPVYATTEGVTQTRLRKIVAQALELMSDHASLTELLPPQRGNKIAHEDIATLIRFLHQPPTANLSLQQLTQLEQRQHPAQLKLAFEELVAHHLSLFQLRQKIVQRPAPKLRPDNKISGRFLAQLPFKLTAAQERVARQVSQDLNKGHPMLRLIQGDVGSGKTMIAVLAALQAVANGYQAAIMAPTEILAEQHLNNFKSWLQPLGINAAWLSGKLSAKPRREELSKIANGEAGIVIGTHALFQSEVEFSRLGLVIIDEQHRFGVHQRLALREKGAVGAQVPHQMIMTATPIPRTLTMCAYADLDVSVIDELPPGRKEVETILISESRRAQVMQRVQESCRKGGQAYWVCTLIEESEKLQCQAAEETARELTSALTHIKLGLVHGRMKAEEKASVMNAFKQGRLDLLVATTVVEVGVDVTKANLMIIENPERLGLAQLHQLRGRVGRGDKNSYCVLMYRSPLSYQAKQRLAVMRETSDGFLIAEKDLELRGPGEVLGTKQSGLVSFKIADFERDQQLFAAARQSAVDLLKSHPANAEQLIQRWLGGNRQYGQV